MQDCSILVSRRFSLMNAPLFGILPPIHATGQRSFAGKNPDFDRETAA
jgi:hypothetical protein